MEAAASIWQHAASACKTDQVLAHILAKLGD